MRPMHTAIVLDEPITPHLNGFNGSKINNEHDFYNDQSSNVQGTNGNLRNGCFSSKIEQFHVKPVYNSEYQPEKPFGMLEEINEESSDHENSGKD